jgi:hypothetical protein
MTDAPSNQFSGLFAFTTVPEWRREKRVEAYQSSFKKDYHQATSFLGSLKLATVPEGRMRN